MKQQYLQSIIRKKWIVTTDSRHNYPVVENKLNRDFTVTRTGQVWVSDITYIKTSQGWLYLTVIIDLYDRKVIGWAFSRSLKAVYTIIPAWRMAIRNRPITQVLIFHSDRGIQYACNEFKNILSSNKLVERSMSRKGDPWDNAVAESFFKTLKVEHIYHNSYKTFREAELSVFEYIEAWYNVNRIHTTIKTSIKSKSKSVTNKNFIDFIAKRFYLIKKVSYSYLQCLFPVKCIFLILKQNYTCHKTKSSLFADLKRYL